MFKNRLLIILAVVFLIILIVIISCSCKKAEKFTQGYNYLIAGCIQKCTLGLERRNPFYNDEEGGYFSSGACERMCAAEYNKNNISDGFPSGGACMVRKPSYKKCPMTFCRYFQGSQKNCPNKNFDLIGNDVDMKNYYAYPRDIILQPYLNF